jgi:hypothetical protein
MRKALGAMAAAVELLVGGPPLLYCVLFTLVSVVLQIFISYKTYCAILMADSFSLCLRWDGLSG